MPAIVSKPRGGKADFLLTILRASSKLQNVIGFFGQVRRAFGMSFSRYRLELRHSGGLLKRRNEKEKGALGKRMERWFTQTRANVA
jgi:hypothetical protein